MELAHRSDAVERLLVGRIRLFVGSVVSADVKLLEEDG
jgi:hypothetical protein